MYRSSKLFSLLAYTNIFMESGEMGKHANGKALHYKGTPFHRIIPGFMIQGGDIVYGNGSGNISIYGGTFRDENFKIKHSHPGRVACPNLWNILCTVLLSMSF